MKKFLHFAYVAFLSFLWSSAQAMILDWQGSYRFEGVQLENAELNSNRKDTSYMLHHLYLKPKIVASDGLVIFSRLDFFNNANYANSQIGQFFGNGPGLAAPNNTNQTNSNVLSQTQKDEQITLTELYLTLKSDSGYGMLIAGRKRFGFGLGMSHNEGLGPFDHWFDSKDLIAYTMVVGNFTFTPMFAKINEGKFNLEDDINDFIVDLSYYNRETDIRFGILYESRVTGGWGNDAPTTGWGSSSNTKVDHWNGQRLSLFYERKWPTTRVGFEAATESGDTGISTGTETIGLSGFGVAFELDYTPDNSRWSQSLKFGFASGDDPKTTSKYEGFLFDRNYNVAFMLMNHVVGQYDFFRTALGRSSTSPNGNDPLASAFVDEETISNVLYLAPNFKYHWKSHWDLDFTFVWAQLNVQPDSSLTIDTNLGYEMDVGVHYKPSAQILWINQLGVLFPGPAFSRAGMYETNYALGLSTKAAISF